MRRTGLIVTSLISMALLFGAARASAVEAKAEPVEVRKADYKVPRKSMLRPLLTPAKFTREGKVDDRLIRPHRSYDASAGLIG
jgi:hypothetical protein